MNEIVMEESLEDNDRLSEREAEHKNRSGGDTWVQIGKTGNPGKQEGPK